MRALPIALLLVILAPAGPARAGDLETRDRGFNEAGEQAWGAEKGPCLFQRRKEAAP
jgi:hypothetical protein